MTDIVKLMYDAMNVFEDNEIAFYAAIKSIHRRTNIEHIVNHVSTHISLEQYRDAFIQIMGFDEKRVEYFTILSKLDFKDTSTIMSVAASYFDNNKITHSNLRKHQEREYLECIIVSSKKLLSKLSGSTECKCDKMHEKQGTLL